MNWLQKIKHSQIEPPHEAGRKAILSVFGWQSFAVVKLLPITEDKEGRSIRVQILDYYGTVGNTNNYYKPDKVLLVGVQNLYYSFEDLLQKELKTVFPDIIARQREFSKIYEAMEDHPELRTNLNFSKLVDYEKTQIYGYDVYISKDPRFKPTPYGALGGIQEAWYWSIPELDKRSLYLELDDSKMKAEILYPWSSGRFADKERAAESAKQFLDFLFYPELEDSEPK